MMTRTGELKPHQTIKIYGYTTNNYLSAVGIYNDTDTGISVMVADAGCKIYRIDRTVNCTLYVPSMV